MTDSPIPPLDDQLGAQLADEIKRIFGDEPRSLPRLSFELPIVSPRDVLEFLRTVPTGTSRKSLSALADQYARGHRSVDGDHEDWAVIELSPPLPNER